MADHLSDEILASRAREGDTGAFEELFHRHKKAVLNFLCRFLGNRQTAEEVAQDAFMKAFRNLHRYDPDRKFLTWLYTIVRNQAKNALRDRKYARDVSLEAPLSGEGEAVSLRDMIADPGADPAAIAQSAELEAEAQKVLDSLPAEYREVIALCSMQGLTCEEAGKIAGCSAAMISVRLNKAKELFMRKLGIMPEET